MPFRPFSKEVAELAALFSREVLVHLPMEADSGEDFGARRCAARRCRAATQISMRAVDQQARRGPHAIGVNNHMGSRFTGDRERMRWVLERVKETGCSSSTAARRRDSVACEVAATGRCAVRERGDVPR